MTRRQLGVCAIVCGLAVGFVSTLRAQGQETKPQRPAPDPLHVETPPSPELERLLAAWEQHSAKIQTLTGRHQRSEFNTVFLVETRSEGQFFFEAPDKGRIDMNGIKLKPDDKSTRVDPNKQPFRLQSGHAERWICTGKDVLQVNDEAKEVEVMPIPPEYQGANIIRSPLPFLFGLKAEEAKKRFHFELIATKPGVEYYSLKIEPKTNQDAFRLAYVALDRQLFVPTKVILFDPAGGMEQRYEFSHIKINDSGIAKLAAEMFGRDPFRPNLANYRRVQAPVVANNNQNAPRMPIPPVEGKVPVQPPVPKTNGPLPGTFPPRSSVPGTSKTVNQPPTKSSIIR